MRGGDVGGGDFRDSDFRDRADDYLDGLIDEAGLKELEAALLADPEARRWFVEYSALHTDLQLAARAQAAGKRALLGLPAFDRAGGGAMRHRPRLRQGLILAACALLLAAALAGIQAMRPADRAPTQPVVAASIATMPHTLRLDFRTIAGGTAPNRRDAVIDSRGAETGFAERLPGTGTALPARDPNLLVNEDQGFLQLTMTSSDLNGQVQVEHGEYLGLRLSSLGFTGVEDFEVSMATPYVPRLDVFGQFGLFAGTSGKRVIRGGLIRFGCRAPTSYSLFFVNNDGGHDTDLNLVNLSSPGDDLRLKLRRAAGKYSLSLENRTAGSSTTLAIAHADYLDGADDLIVGVFGANSERDEMTTLLLKELEVTVWK